MRCNPMLSTNDSRINSFLKGFTHLLRGDGYRDNAEVLEDRLTTAFYWEDYHTLVIEVSADIDLEMMQEIEEDYLVNCSAAYDDDLETVILRYPEGNFSKTLPLNFDCREDFTEDPLDLLLQLA